MKLRKYVSLGFCAIIIFTCIFAIFSFNSNAESNRDYYISNYQVEVNINPDGSADFTEYQTYKFSGQFNGIKMTIDESQSGGLYDPKVFIKNGSNMNQLLQSNSNSSGTYTFTKNNYLNHFKVYEPSQNTEKTFVFSYSLKDAVTKYTDIAEFNRKIIGTKFDKPITNVYVKITIPSGATKDQLKVFAHGPLSGVSKIVDDRNFEFTVPGLNPGSFLEAHLLFPTSIIPDSNNIVNKNMLTSILEYEAKLAQESNDIRNQQIRDNILGIVLAIILAIICIVILIYIYFKYDREKKSSFMGKYYREIEDKYTPSEMSYLIRDTVIKPIDMMATLIDLVRKKRIKMEVKDTEEKHIFSNKHIKDYVFSTSDDQWYKGLKKHEIYVFEFFKQICGDKNSFSINQLKSTLLQQSKRSNSQFNTFISGLPNFKNGMELIHDSQINTESSNSINAKDLFINQLGKYPDFKSGFKLWTSYVEQEANKNMFFEKNNKGKNITLAIGIIEIILGLICAFIGFQLSTAAVIIPVVIVLVVMGLVSIGYSTKIHMRTPYGNEEFSKWKAFKRFLKDFSRINHVTLPSLVIWEQYLVYAISLGVATKVIKDMPKVYNENDFNNPHLTYLGLGMYGSSFSGLNNMSGMFSSFQDVEQSMSSAIHPSSSTGSGGGFSIGSSGGGGGGSGGGAF